MANLILGTDTLNQGREKINDAITQSEQALNTSNNAVNIANGAVTTANSAVTIANSAVEQSQNTQEQLNTIVINGDSSVEAAQARVSIGSRTFSTLKERIDTQLSEVCVNVKDFGARGDGVTDDTIAIQNALDYSLHVFLPRGIYILSDTLYARGKTVIEGENAETTILRRNGSDYGHTLVIGNDDNTGSNFANNCIVRNIWFLRDFSFTPGVTMEIQNPVSPESAHLRINAGQYALIEHCIMECMPILIDLISSSNITIRKNALKGSIYDGNTSGLQEGLACIRIKDSDFNLITYSQLISIYDNYITGGFVSESKRCGNREYNNKYGRNNRMPYGIYAERAEGLTIHNNYFGANWLHNIFLYGTGLLTNIKIYGNFFDGAHNYCIGVNSQQNYPIVGVQIYGNDFNMQTINPGALFVMGYDNWMVANKIVFTNNNVENSTKCPILLYGSSGTVIVGNTITAYNCVRGEDDNPLLSAGIYCNGISTGTFTSGNMFGGGVNNLSPTVNGCKWGVYYGTGTGYSVNENTIGFGVTGGKVIDGTTQLSFNRADKKTVTLQNSWISMETPYYYMDNNGEVHLTGRVSSGIISSPIFILPDGYRPSNTIRFPIVSNDALGLVYVNELGEVVCYFGNNSSVTLDGISFQTS